MNIMAISTKRVVSGPKKFQMTPKKMEPGTLTMIWSRKAPYNNRNTANIIRQITIIPMTARICSTLNNLPCITRFLFFLPCRYLSSQTHTAGLPIETLINAGSISALIECPRITQPEQATRSG